MKVYIATPIEPAHHTKEEVLQYAEKISNLCEAYSHETYKPWTIHIAHAWELSNGVWGQVVFENDIKAIDECDVMVAIGYDRKESTAGTCFEIGYAYAKGIPVILVEHESVKTMSLMVSNGSTAQVAGCAEFENLLSALNIGLRNDPELTLEEYLNEWHTMTEVC